MADAKLSIIVGMDSENHIGLRGDMPWGRSQKDDLLQFRNKTWGKPIIMGRNTYESIGKPLAGRTNIIVSRMREPGAQANGAVFVQSVDAAITMANDLAVKSDNSKYFVIGGGEIYKATIDRADYLYVTLFDGDFGGDTFFPNIDPERWEKVIERRGPEQSDDNPHLTYYITYARK